MRASLREAESGVVLGMQTDTVTVVPLLRGRNDRQERRVGNATDPPKVFAHQSFFGA
jgi:hypothetical protein